MKNKKKKRGFTLVELLATITILSVVMIIAIPSVTKLIKKFGNNYYEMIEGNIKLAGIDYFTDHKTDIPKYNNESSVISLNDLVTKGYIEETPKDKNKEDIREGYVIAYKTNKGKYEYQACINTQNNDYKTDKKYCSDIYKLDNNVILVPPSNGVYALPQKMPENFDNIITPYAATKQKKESNSIRNILNSEGTVAPVKAIVSCEKECKNIATGEYEGDLKGKLNAIISNYFKTDEDKEPLTEEAKNKLYKKNLKDFLNKKIKIKYIYQYGGKTAEALFSFVEANEGEAPGEIQVVLNKTTENGGQVYGTVKDEAWKPTDISEIPENTNLINWYNKKLVAIVSPINANEKRIKKYFCEYDSNPGNIFECSDETINNSIQRISYSEANDIIKIYGVNKYGIPTPNTVTYSVKTDAVAPSVPSSKVNNVYSTGETYGWTKDNITWSDFNANDSLSGIDHYEYSTNCTGTKTGNLVSRYTYSTNSNIKFCIRSVDKAGNTSAWSEEYNFKIDKTPPTCKSSGGSSSWTKNNVTVTGTCSDTGGSGCKTPTVTQTKNSDYNGSVSPGTVYDNAGNSVKCSNETVKIDKTAPTCTSSGGSSSWTKNNVTVTGTCSDSGSGCKTSTVTQTKKSDYNGSVSPGTVYDNVGNSVTCSSKTVKIDKTAPTVNIIYLSGSNTNSWDCGYPSLKVGYKVSDSHSGINAVYDVFGYDDNDSETYNDISEYVYHGAQGTVWRVWGSTDSDACRGKNKNGTRIDNKPGSYSTYRIKIAVKDNVGNTAVYWSNQKANTNNSANRSTCDDNDSAYNDCTEIKK